MTRLEMSLICRALAFTILLGISPALAQENAVTFDNQSGEPALVKLVGPSNTVVEVPTGGKRTVSASAGQYHIKVRYGTPGRYRYARGDNFKITETTTQRSETSITLHKVIGGNYGTRAISEEEFAAVAARRTQKTPQGTTYSDEVPAGPWKLGIVSFDTKDRHVYKYCNKSEVLVGTGDERVAIIKIRGNRVRQYNDSELKEMEDCQGKELIRAARALTGEAPFFATKSFTLVYVQPDPRTGQDKLILSQCRGLTPESGLQGPVCDMSGQIVTVSESDTVEATLLFRYYAKYNAPILLFSPIPGGEETVGARLTWEPDGNMSVQYGDLKAVSSLIPSGFLK